MDDKQAIDVELAKKRAFSFILKVACSW